MQICHQCNFTNPNGATFCNGCGCHLKGIENPLIDRIIDKYRLKEKVGVGGFGTVYRAAHTELQNSFAIKILHPHLLDNEQMVERFRREARLLAGLRHQNIVQVIDFGHVDGIGFYLVMEWLEGKTLQWHLKEEGLPPYEILLQIFEQLLDALAHAHEAGIVHRDLKPENLVLLPGSRNRRTLKILDFGIARMVNDRGPSRITETGLAVGTPRYMSPEQAAGDIDRVDHRADIYAVGVLLAELLTGKQLFLGTTNEVLLHQIDTPAPRLSELAPEMNFPTALDWVLQRALAKDPEKRFSTATEFADALMAILEGDTTHLSPSNPSPMRQQIPQRTPGHTPHPSISGPHQAPDFVGPLGPQTPTHALPGYSRSMPGVPSRLLKQPLLAETRAIPSGRAQPPVSLLERELPPSYTGIRGEKKSGVYPHQQPPEEPPEEGRTTGWFWASIGLLGAVGVALFFFILSMWETQPARIAPLKQATDNQSQSAQRDDLPGLPPAGSLPRIDPLSLPAQRSPSDQIPALPRPTLSRPERPRPVPPTPPDTAPPVDVAPPKRPQVRKRSTRRRRKRRTRRTRRRPRRPRVATPPPVAKVVYVSLVIKSIPSGADITINGLPRGLTPKTFKIPDGKGIIIRLQKNGYFIKTKPHRVSGSGSLTLRLVKNIFNQ